MKIFRGFFLLVAFFEVPRPCYVWSVLLHEGCYPRQVIVSVRLLEYDEVLLHSVVIVHGYRPIGLQLESRARHGGGDICVIGHLPISELIKGRYLVLGEPDLTVALLDDKKP